MTETVIPGHTLRLLFTKPTDSFIGGPINKSCRIFAAPPGEGGGTRWRPNLHSPAGTAQDAGDQRREAENDGPFSACRAQSRETPSCLSASGKSSAPKSQTRTPPGRPRRFGVRNEVVLLKISGIRHVPSVYTLRSILRGNFCFSPNFQTVELFTDTRSVFPNILS